MRRTQNLGTILLVDDEPDITALFKEELVNVGFQVQVAKDGLEAIQKVRLQSYDCIVTDLVMPKIEGDDFIDLVREEKHNSKTPIVVMSGNLDPIYLDNIKGKIKKAFTKPVDVSEFIEYIKKCIPKAK